MERDQDGWARLGHAVKQRRQWLQLSHSGVSRRGGPSHETVRLVETHGRDSFRDLTLSQLDRGLQWKPGIARKIVDGTAPKDQREWEAELSAEEIARRSDVRHIRTPDGMSPLTPALDGVSDMDLAAEVVKRVGRGGNRALVDLLRWAAQYGDPAPGDDGERRAV